MPFCATADGVISQCVSGMFHKHFREEEWSSTEAGGRCEKGYM